MVFVVVVIVRGAGVVVHECGGVFVVCSQVREGGGFLCLDPGERGGAIWVSSRGGGGASWGLAR